MAEFELVGCDKVIDDVCQKHNIKRSEAIRMWASQFQFIRNTIADKCIRNNYYPGFLIRGFGKMYCHPYRLKQFKKQFGGEDESI